MNHSGILFHFYLRDKEYYWSRWTKRMMLKRQSQDPIKKKNKEKKRKEHDHRTFFPSIDSIFLTFDIDATREI